MPNWMNRKMRFARLGSLLVAVVVCLGGWLAGVAAGAVPLHGLHVSGRYLVDDAAHTVSLRGVNRAGSEYACVDGFGIFDGPSDDASVQAIASWHINFVRVLLN